MSCEPDEGRGPVDFKISRGQDITIVEVKLTSNDQYLHGFEVQIEEYGKAEQTDNLVYVLVDLGHPRKVQKVCDLRDRKVDGSFFIWLFLPACVIIWKSIIFPACLILRRCQPHPLFCYIQENLNAFNSLLTAERSADAVLLRRRSEQSLCFTFSKGGCVYDQRQHKRFINCQPDIQVHAVHHAVRGPEEPAGAV